MGKIIHPNIPEVVKRLNSAEPLKFIGGYLEDIGRIITIEQMARTPVDSGNLRDNHEWMVISYNDDTVDLVVENDTDYAKFVEFGWGSEGKLHPPEYYPPELEWTYGDMRGYMARPYFYPVILSYEDEINSRLAKAAEEAAKHVIP